MKNRTLHRKSAFLLLTVCFIMLVAAVVPHHHHFELGSLCMLNDVERCEPSCHSDTHHHQGNDQTCETGCVTTFVCPVPPHVHHILPPFSFITDLSFLSVTFRVVLFENKLRECPVRYVESLHSKDCRSIYGLRAPPQA